MSLHFKEIGLSDRELVLDFLKKDSFFISDISFGNLYIWRHSRRIGFCIISGCLVIETICDGMSPFVFYPIGDGDKTEALRALLEYYKGMGLSLEIHSVEKRNMDSILSVFSDVDYRLNRDRSDYLYLTEDLANLPGRKFHAKRNHVSKFIREYGDVRYESINEGNLDTLKQAWDAWKARLDEKDRGLVNESRGVDDVFKNYFSLGLRGGFLRVDREVVAFSFGEIVSADMCVIHVEKSLSNYVGAYQAINQFLLKNEFIGTKITNREEDLGIEGLRRAKLSYFPMSILDKYDVVVRS